MFFNAVMGREHCKALVSEGKISCANCFVKEKLGIAVLPSKLFLCVSTVLYLGNIRAS